MKWWSAFLLATLAILLQSPERARADEVFEFVKFICREDLRYLEFEPIIIMNALDYAALKDPDLVAVFDRKRESRQGIVLRECKLEPPDNRVFSLHSNWRRPPGNGASGGGWSEGLEVRLNGSRLAVFVAGSRSISFRIIVSDGRLTVCRRTKSGVREQTILCKWMRLDEWLASPTVFNGSE